MVKIRNTEVFGLNRAIKASGNPMIVGAIDTTTNLDKNDLIRAEKLGKAPNGSGHDNFLTGITVVFDVKYPQYWSMEFQRYHFTQIISSTSKMHRLVASAKSNNFAEQFNEYVDKDIIKRIQSYVSMYNECEEKEKYGWFMQILSNLPMGYELWMTVTTNYAQLKTIYNQRKNHKLKEDWEAFCTMIENLPLFKELTGI